MSNILIDLLTPRTYVNYQCPVCESMWSLIEIQMNRPLNLGRQCPKCLAVWPQSWDDTVRAAVLDFWKREEDATRSQ